MEKRLLLIYRGVAGVVEFLARGVLGYPGRLHPPNLELLKLTHQINVEKIRPYYESLIE